MPRQTEITGDGFERPVIKPIELAAEDYVNKREKFQRASEACTEAKTALLAVMQANSAKLPLDAEKNRIYRFDDEVVILTEKLQVKVKAAHEEEEAA